MFVFRTTLVTIHPSAKPQNSLRLPELGSPSSGSIHPSAKPQPASTDACPNPPSSFIPQPSHHQPPLLLPELGSPSSGSMSDRICPSAGSQNSLRLPELESPSSGSVSGSIHPSAKPQPAPTEACSNPPNSVSSLPPWPPALQPPPPLASFWGTRVLHLTKGATASKPRHQAGKGWPSPSSGQLLGNSRAASNQRCYGEQTETPGWEGAA